MGSGKWAVSIKKSRSKGEVEVEGAKGTILTLTLTLTALLPAFFILFIKSNFTVGNTTVRRCTFVFLISPLFPSFVYV